MKADLVWTPQAREDLLDIYVAIGCENPGAAERLYTAIEGTVELLANQPRLGVRRPEIRRAARMLVHGPYLIVYEVHPDRAVGPVKNVEIVRVVDGRRDLTRLF